MSPRYSPDRRAALLSVAECSELVGRSEKTIKRWLKHAGVYVEYHQVPTAAGNTVRAAFIDPTTLPVALEGYEGDSVPADELSPYVERLVEAKDLRACASILCQVKPGLRSGPARLTAERFGVSLRTVYRWVKRLEKGQALAQRKRRDAGRPRIPAAAREVLIAAFASNPPTTPTRTIYWTVKQAAPDALRYERGGRERLVSLRTAHRLRAELEADPRTALIFADDDQRKEFLRVYSGSVLSNHANDLWQLDMTRCDILVCDPETKRVFRPRVHAVIDHYSGCIVGIVFSEEEDQAQTDLALLRALVRKPPHLNWPMFGVPKRLYVDNGKTYTSQHFHRILADLGVEVVHSRPRVSHTRGKVERFFGTLHGFEKTQPGYVGPNAKDRSSETLRRLEKRTRKWLEGEGRDLEPGDRLLTIGEYQFLFVHWLSSVYHETVVDGLTRAEHFARTAPAETLLDLDINELMLVFAPRVKRRVDAGGRVRLDNRFWTVADGSLAEYQGYDVLVLREPFVFGEERLLIAFEDARGRLEVVGPAVPATAVAASIEAEDYRRAAKAAVVAAERRARQAREELANPELRYSTQLIKSARVALPPTVKPSARAQLEVVNPGANEEEAFAGDDPIGQVILARQQAAKGGPTDPLERAQWLLERTGGGEKQ